ncbi:ABC transporter ATP-binding protein [Paenibacillus ginsengarvi]|uniref:ABC transporter ATP-binding protein n=1 Tax=Paenibacillus ginsengarvi TaxID=400777 RepID=UPI001F005602|nr:ABC transporter ATP-binding protein [Paenibacillus ginsengarvi]
MFIHMDVLSKRYGKFQAVQDVTLTIGKGMFGLLGPNGAGKTTLLRVLSTTLPPSGGSVTIGNYRLGRDDQAIRSLLGYLPQEFGLPKQLTGYEYLDYAAVMKGFRHSQRRRTEVESVLEKVNMSARAKERTGTYSGGMKQRIGIAQALLGSPELIVVDEPTAGLDPEERMRFRSLLSELSANRTVLLSTHIVADIAATCCGLAVMKRGRLVYDGSLERLLETVRGRVWTGYVSESRFDGVRMESNVISARKAAYGYDIRVLSGTRPFEGATLAPAALEDAYLYVLRSEGMESE